MTLNEYMELPYRMEIVPDKEEGGYAVMFPELPGCMTCGATLESAVSNAEDAKKEWFMAAPFFTVRFRAARKSLFYGWFQSRA